MSTTDEAPHFYTVRETAERLRLSKKSVYEMVRRGDIPAKKFGGRWRIPAHAVSVEADAKS